MVAVVKDRPRLKIWIRQLNERLARGDLAAFSNLNALHLTVELGWAVLTFNFRGTGASAGNFSLGGGYSGAKKSWRSWKTHCNARLRPKRAIAGCLSPRVMVSSWWTQPRAM